MAVSATSADSDPYEDYPEDDSRDTENVDVSIQIATDLKAIGNTAFKSGDVKTALEKWQSTFIVIDVRHETDLLILLCDLQRRSGTSTYTPSCQTAPQTSKQNHSRRS